MGQERIYNDPNGSPSSVGTQFNTFYYQKKALIEARKEQYFSQMADVTSMPKNMGKTIKRYHYVPLLDDANINDQGIDANGLIANGVDSGTIKITIIATPPSGADPVAVHGQPGFILPEYFVAEHAVEATAEAAAEALRDAWIVGQGLTDVAGAVAAGWTFAQSATVPNTGNLYGSSKDVGTITGKMPALSEQGGRVNRVGFKRIELEGSIEKFGFFDEYTKESLDFDTDAELEMHINREMIFGANEITEDALQIDLLNGAGVIVYGGEAIATSELTGDTNDEANVVASVITYEDLMKLSITLDDNRCPKNTKIITGTRMIDTKTIDAARYLYIGSELIPMIKRMTDLFSNQAFIPVQQYAAGTTIATGEIGSVDQFRVIVVPEMMHWAGAGGTVEAAGDAAGTNGVNAGYRETGGVYDVFPMLVVGSASFTTIGFQTDGKTVKFKIKHSKPESNMSYSHDDPYGELGFMSIKWYYGSMILRAERIALCKSVAEW